LFSATLVSSVARVPELLSLWRDSRTYDYRRNDNSRREASLLRLFLPQGKSRPLRPLNIYVGTATREGHATDTRKLTSMPPKLDRHIG